MTDLPKPSPPNWVQKGEFWLKCIGLAGVFWLFLTIEWHWKDLDRRKKEIEVAFAEEKSFSLAGEVLSPEVFAVDKKDTVPLCPVFITIKNTCQRPIQVERIDFRILVAPLREVSKFKAIEAPKGELVLTSTAPGNEGADRTTLVGMIDPASPKWKVISEVSQSVEIKGTLSPGQQSVERRHFFAPTVSSSILTKIEVTVHASGHKRTWYGFANPEMCRRVPFDAEAVEPAPAAAAVAAPAE